MEVNVLCYVIWQEGKQASERESRQAIVIICAAATTFKIRQFQLARYKENNTIVIISFSRCQRMRLECVYVYNVHIIIIVVVRMLCTAWMLLDVCVFVPKGTT